MSAGDEPVLPASVRDAAVVDAITARLTKRTSSSYGRLGVERTREVLVLGAFAALEQDLSAGNYDAVRKFVITLMDEALTVGVTFSDLRVFSRTLRAHLNEALEPSERELRATIERWCYELLEILTMRYISWREKQFQQETAKARVARLESQLGELEVALAEKVELLAMIHEASTPIVPVVQGILVVPLVGTFDPHRAELLAENLLTEVSRTHARTAIIDISGVPVFDTATVQLMMRLARSVRLLGTRVYLCGMSPQNARTIVDLGVDLTTIKTFATLQDGLATALRGQSLKIGAL